MCFAVACNASAMDIDAMGTLCNIFGGDVLSCNSVPSSIGFYYVLVTVYPVRMVTFKSLVTTPHVNHALGQMAEPSFHAFTLPSRYMMALCCYFPFNYIGKTCGTRALSDHQNGHVL
jgi:hypothetical protein